MEQNILVTIEQTKQQIATIINNSNLPIFVLEPMIKDIYVELSELRKKMLEQELSKVNSPTEEKEKEETK